MISLKNDYNIGAHAAVIKRLTDINDDSFETYGLDVFSIKATEKIRTLIADSAAEVHFLAGGTITNITALAAFLLPYQAVITVETGHINIHETGAIEATGHKILTVKSADGKLSPDGIKAIYTMHTDEHMVVPKLVYISQATECGTYYTKNELTEIYNICQNLGLLLYIDGARLGSALAVEDARLTLADVARLSDAFYIGGTKNGALFGEALVITNDSLKINFRYSLKQRGAMMAKGWLVGAQFDVLLDSGLYVKIAQAANHTSDYLRAKLAAAGYRLYLPTKTNQTFLIIDKIIVDKIKKHVDFITWCEYDDNNAVIRLITSFTTTKPMIDEFITLLRRHGA